MEPPLSLRERGQGVWKKKNGKKPTKMLRLVPVAKRHLIARYGVFANFPPPIGGYQNLVGTYSLPLRGGSGWGD